MFVRFQSMLSRANEGRSADEKIQFTSSASQNRDVTEIRLILFALPLHMQLRYISRGMSINSAIHHKKYRKLTTPVHTVHLQMSACSSNVEKPLRTPLIREAQFVIGNGLAAGKAVINCHCGSAQTALGKATPFT